MRENNHNTNLWYQTFVVQRGKQEMLEELRIQVVGFEGRETSVYRFLVKEGKWRLDKGVDKKIMNEQH